MALTIYKPEWGAMRPIRGVLFDMDGLVLDTEKLYSRFWMEACHALGYPMTYAQSLTMRSLNHAAGQARLREYFGPEISHAQVRNLRIALMDAYIADHGVESKPGIFALLDHLESRGIPTAIASSSPIARIRHHLGSNGLLHRFDKLCSVSEVSRGKPFPDIYLYSAVRLGLEPENCLALEDSPTGILSAYRAGCLPVMIPDQDQPDENTRSLLYAKADSLTDIIGLIK